MQTRRFACALLAALGTAAYGQTYPMRPVTFIVPFPPGGGTDISARTVAQKLSAKWLHPVVPENRAGAAGIVGANAAAQAKPDGHTLLIVNVGVVSINPSLYGKLPYNPDTAFAPVSLICELPFVLMASPKLQANSVKELIALAKANPDKVTYASSGSGGSPHLTAEIFQLVTGTRMTHVPYKGGGPAMTDLMAGHVDLLFASVLEGSGHIKAGKLKGLAVTPREAQPRASRRADDRRGRRARRRIRLVDRTSRARGHAEGDHRQGRRRCEGGGRVTRGARQADRAGRGAAGEHARGAAKAHRRGPRPLRQDYSRQGLEGRIEG